MDLKIEVVPIPVSDVDAAKAFYTEQVGKKGAKSFQRAVRAGDGGVAAVVREFHPRLPDAQPGSSELERFTRADAQLVIARQFAFAS